jgi:hypothetical protein
MEDCYINLPVVADELVISVNQFICHIIPKELFTCKLRSHHPEFLLRKKYQFENFYLATRGTHIFFNMLEEGHKALSSLLQSTNCALEAQAISDMMQISCPEL